MDMVVIEWNWMYVVAKYEPRERVREIENIDSIVKFGFKVLAPSSYKSFRSVLQQQNQRQHVIKS